LFSLYFAKRLLYLDYSDLMLLWQAGGSLKPSFSISCHAERLPLYPYEPRRAPRRVEIKRKVRCAVYTRKSSEEGLELAFNSLDAQREACAAYIGSQRHEGWLALADRYDDGGYSCGTLERRALQRLIRDIEARRHASCGC
jgi:hypothetical protein